MNAKITEAKNTIKETVATTNRFFAKNKKKWLVGGALVGGAAISFFAWKNYGASIMKADEIVEKLETI